MCGCLRRKKTPPKTSGSGVYIDIYVGIDISTVCHRDLIGIGISSVSHRYRYLIVIAIGVGI